MGLTNEEAKLLEGGSNLVKRAITLTWDSTGGESETKIEIK
jgi:hypothetical protein